MTTPRGQAPLTENTRNARPVLPPRRSAQAPAKAPAKVKAQASAKAQAQAEEPAVRKLSPFDILGLRETAGALRFLGEVALRHPLAVLRTAPDLSQELVKISLGRSQVAPEKGDKRFADSAWQQNPWFRATMQSYLTWGSGMERYLDHLDLPGTATERIRFGAVLLRDAMAPTNFFATNPAAVKRCYDTGGGSVRRGLANWLGDLRHNHGMPSMVDRRPFTVGENLAATPGQVIFRNEVFELIQYTPQSETVYARPILMVPPQVNKYYALDLSPGRSLYEYLLQRGIQVFGISWRSPTGAQRDWNFDTYVQATVDAIDVVREVSGSPDVNLMGGCLGGMTAALTQAYLAALGEEDRIHSSTMFVTLLDTESTGRMFLLGTPQMLELAKLVTVPTGVIDGWQMGSTFAWLRPNDLVWNYWVNNYLLGQDPPAFDILAWNADTTRLTKGFHHQLLDIVAQNQIARPGAMTVLGTPVDLSRISTDTYVAAGLTDHITPWQTCYRTTQLVSGHSEFVLCSSGHIQTVVADPKHRGLGYFVNPATPPRADDWMAAAERYEGSWWEHWVRWLAGRSGEQGAAPSALGSTRFPPIQAAPGSYILT
jgi:poly[(R)-3-hydroxyalkanoate] polymerase subunit PhaC